MKEYLKIQTVYLRNPDTNFKTLLEGLFAKPEFELLKDCQWIWTEKVDGTNIRVMFTGEKVYFGGKTDNAQTPTFLLQVLQDMFPLEKMQEVFGVAGLEGSPRVCLYGEGYGAKIQKGGGRYIPNGSSFILFDVKIGDWWLERENVEDIANKLGIDVVPIVGKGSLLEAVEFAR